MRRWLMCIGLLALGGPATALEIVAPHTLASAEGNSNLGAGFTGGGVSSRYQQLYGASDFGALDGPILIHALAFRPDAQVGSVSSVTIPHVQINLSTTTKTPLTLSTTYVHNVGADDTIVFDTRALTLSTAFTGPAGGPKDFDVVIPLETSFLYDPALGSLLLDVRTYDAGIFGFSQLDSLNSTTDGIARVYQPADDSVNFPMGQQILTDGYVTRFSYTLVPEPASALLLGAGLAALAAIRRR